MRDTCWTSWLGSSATVASGGLGERIVAGLAVNDTAYMMAGAIPAALLALFVQGSFHLVERVIGLRRSRAERP